MSAHRYTPFYCEENCWWLAQDPRFSGSRVEVVFITNATRSVALFHQRAAEEPEAPVVWDYHVVVCEYRDNEARIWDLDCTLGAPLTAPRWLEASFDARVLPGYAPRFRLVEASTFVRGFVSDRRHMLALDGSWQAPPPPWPAIGRGLHNLDEFVDVADPRWGRVLDLDAFRAACAR